MRARPLVALLGACALLAVLAPVSPAAPPAQPAWQLEMTPIPANFAPGARTEYLITATNVGGAPTDGSQVRVQATLPNGLLPLSASAGGDDRSFLLPPSCEAPLGQSVSCETEEVLHPDHRLDVAVAVEVQAPGTPGEVLSASASVEGGGAAAFASAESPTPISSGPVPFGFLAGFAAPLSKADGTPSVLAGSHPHQLSVAFDFPTERQGNELLGTEHPRDIRVDLPRGLSGDPAATGVRCTEAELITGACPPASQVGTITATIIGLGNVTPTTSPLFNTVPPPGAPAAFSSDIAEVGLAFPHLLAGLRSEGDYGIYAVSEDLPALGRYPLFGIQTRIWGDTSAAAHRWARRGCFSNTTECPPLPPQRLPFLTMPAQCPGAPQSFQASADSWEEPGLFRSAEYQSADLAGNPVVASGCNAEPFAPTIEAQPTTNQADSPTGLEVDLHQPQHPPVAEGEDPLQGLASSPLKDARVTLPAGMAVNPSQADGLVACTEEEIGYPAEDKKPGIHFSKQPNSCPDAAKLGTMEAASPLLAQYTEGGTKLATDPETGAPIPRPLKGSVYLAQPYQNPFGSQLAIYLAIEDPESGIVAKLGGKVETDPQTGQLTTVFEENPELPLEDVKLHLFNGARAPLITPLTCATHTTTSDLTPWSAPEGADAHPSDSFQVTAEPGGGACPASEAAAANAPSFEAGTVSPQAGAFTPFVLKLHREDGSQRLTGIDTTLPPGLSGKLAGIPECSDAQVAQAVSREHPEEGMLERNSPSCPSSSEVGTVDVAAGAGPTPFHTTGHAYLAGPYKGAPLSLAVIVPAVAGPFDLGAVLNRVALRLDPETAQIHAVSDPFPTIIDGIPLDLRSLTLEMGRPNFTLNPTNCEEMQILGSATSALGQIAPLTERFQVGECQKLAFKPKLTLALKGKTKRTSHPTLIANLTAKPGEANIAKAQVKLPAAAFIDQAHIATVCTRVQFAADQCPPGSVYGKASATTPLLDAPLSGSVYLRSSNHLLPDLVVKLKGPDAQPIEIDLVGKTDSVKGALRNTFEAVPDAPVSKFHLELFGGKRGLIILSSGLCANPNGNVQLTGQSGKSYDTNPVVKTSCPKPHHKKHHAKRRQRLG